MGQLRDLLMQRLRDSLTQRKPVPTFVLVVAAIPLGIAAGLLHIILYALQYNHTVALSVLGVAASTAAASFTVGALFGFLFGIPRTLQQDVPQKLSAAAQDGEKEVQSDKEQETRYRANTNLEQISDWLTKILVGVGLTQLNNLPARLNAIGAALAPGLGDGPSARPFALSILVYFVVFGFLAGYIITRLYFAAALRAADQQIEALGRKVDELDAFRKQYGNDALAVSLKNKQLDPNARPVEQDELDRALTDASPSTRAQIYYAAKDTYLQNRERNWELVDRAIPLFRALIASEKSSGPFHMNHGQLGRALTRSPHWKEAIAELSKAISIRGSWQESHVGLV